MGGEHSGRPFSTDQQASQLKVISAFYDCFGAEVFLYLAMAKEKVAPRKSNTRKKPSVRKKRPIVQKDHPWRECPVDHHWVRPQIKHREPSKKHPDGIVPYRGFCRINRSRKSSIYPDELNLIAEKYFQGLGKDIPLDQKFKKKDQFNDLIAGWTKYWNDIFKPTTPLDPVFVKALLASESGFDLNPVEPSNGKAGKARGMMQLTDETLRLMDTDKGGVSDYLVHLTHEEAREPNLAIAGGVRWLFQKKTEATAVLKREPTWTEVIIFYKGYANDYKKGKSLDEMNGVDIFRKAYQRITGRDLEK